MLHRRTLSSVKVAPRAPPQQNAPSRASLLARIKAFNPQALGPLVRCFLQDFTQGLADSLSMHRTIMFLIESPTVRVNTVKSLLLNGLLFLGSHYFYHLVMAPGLKSLGLQIYSYTAPPSQPSPWVESVVTYFSYWSYQLIWMWPFYLLSFFVSISLNQEVAMAAFQCREQPTSPNSQAQAAPIPELMVNWVRRIAMVYLLLFQTIVMSWVPYVGPLSSFIFTCWLDAFYAFQYVWALRGVRVERQTRWIEHDWGYYLGFGWFTSLACHCTAFFVGAGCYAMIFPFCVLTAMTSEPRSLVKAAEDPSTDQQQQDATLAPPLGQAPVFWAARRMSAWLMGTVNAAVTGQTPSKRGGGPQASRGRRR